jgi:hypothetical protein
MQKLLLFFVPILLSLSACHKDPDPQHGLDLSGTKWVVTSFLDNTKDETSDFTGYSFEFKSDGTFVAYLPDATVVSGNWHTHDHEAKLQINVNGVQHLDKINDDWTLLEKTATSMKLQDNNPSHPEEIHFQKI